MKESKSQKKSIRKVRSISEATFEDMAVTFFLLRVNLACNMFIMDHPEYNYPFPYNSAGFHHESKKVGMLGGYLNPPAEIIDKIKNYNIETKSNMGEKPQVREKTLKQRADDFIHNGASFENVDIKDKESFNTMYDYCSLMELICDKIHEKLTQQDIEESEVCAHTFMNICFWLSMDLTQKYFELMGYWTRIMEERAKKRNSGKGQKEAKKERLKKLTDSISKFVNDKKKEGRQITHFDKGIFLKMLSGTFTGAENYQRHPQTIAIYQKEVESELGIKIVKKVSL